MLFFGVRAGKFLGYLITNRGIEVNPDQIEAVKCLKPPSNPKEVQVLTRMLAALNQFISKFANRCRPFYQLLRKWKGFQWNEECDRAFQDLKDYLMQVPMLLELGEDLFIYLSMFDHAMSVVLLRDQGVQQPVYYISKTLVGDKVLTLGEVSVSPNICYEEVAALFSDSYYICPHRVSFIVVVEDIKLHRLNS